MPQRLHYDIEITNQYSGGSVRYKTDSLMECAKAINQHYGLHDMITRNGVVNMLVRGSGNSPKRFSAIRIERSKAT
jgi:hypothetical protein